MIGVAIAVSIAMTPDPNLRTLCESIGDQTLTEFATKGLKKEMIGFAVGVIDRDKRSLRFGGFQLHQTFYPASVVKAFYMNYAANELQAGRLKLEGEFERALRDMIVDSSNDATGHVVDVLTQTTGGPELTGSEWDSWRDKRQVVNRWYAKRGYEGVNACQKTWGDGPFGRERAFYGAEMENRNRLTALSGVKLFAEIALDSSLESIQNPTRDWNDWMVSLLTRKAKDPQFDDFIGAIIPEGSIHRSKAGWTSSSRSDVAWITFPDKRELVIAIFTNGREVANEPGIIQSVAKKLIQEAK